MQSKSQLCDHTWPWRTASEPEISGVTDGLGFVLELERSNTWPNWWMSVDPTCKKDLIPTKKRCRCITMAWSPTACGTITADEHIDFVFMNSHWYRLPTSTPSAWSSQQTNSRGHPSKSPCPLMSSRQISWMNRKDWHKGNCMVHALWWRRGSQHRIIWLHAYVEQKKATHPSRFVSMTTRKTVNLI